MNHPNAFQRLLKGEGSHLLKRETQPEKVEARDEGDSPVSTDFQPPRSCQSSSQDEPSLAETNHHLAVG